MEAKFLASALSFLSIFLAISGQSLGKYHPNHPTDNPTISIMINKEVPFNL